MYMYHVYKYLIQKEICSSNFPIVSTLFWEIPIVYFRETTIQKKLFWVAVDGVVNTTDV